MTKINNKLLFLILAILIFAVLLVSSKFTTFAAAEPTITVGSAKGNAGDTVDVTITMSNNPGLVSMNLYVNYDTDVLKLIEVKDGGLLSGVTHSDNYTSPYSLCWVNDLSKENFKVNGVLAKLTFEIFNNAKDSSTVSLDQDILNCDMENVDFNLISGKIEVGNSSQSKDNDSQASGFTESNFDSNVSSIANSGKYSENIESRNSSDVKASDASKNNQESVDNNATVLFKDDSDVSAEKSSPTDSAKSKGGLNRILVILIAIIIIVAVITSGFIYCKYKHKTKK